MTATQDLTDWIGPEFVDDYDLDAAVDALATAGINDPSADPEKTMEILETALLPTTAQLTQQAAEQWARELYDLAADGGETREAVTVQVSPAEPRDDGKRHSRVTLTTPAGRVDPAWGYQGWVWLTGKPDKDTEAIREAQADARAETRQMLREAEQRALRAHRVVRDAEAQRRAAKATRDEAIRDWLVAGASVSMVARGLSVSRQAVEQIRDRT